MSSFVKRIFVTRSISGDLWLDTLPNSNVLLGHFCQTQGPTFRLSTTRSGTLEASASAAQSGHAKARYSPSDTVQYCS